jgi:homoserine dehydrogenase
VSRAKLSHGGELALRVAPESIPRCDLLATAQGTSNLLLLDTDLMGTLGVMSINPGVDQTAYGVFSDLVDIARSV